MEPKHSLLRMITNYFPIVNKRQKLAGLKEEEQATGMDKVSNGGSDTSLPKDTNSENKDTNDLQPEIEQSKDSKSLSYPFPPDWYNALLPEINKQYFKSMILKIKSESLTHTIYPPEIDWFNFMQCPIDKVKVVIIGQDPYHGPNQAHGLSFSVRMGIKPPPSLVNIFKECASDLGDSFQIPSHGNLTGWLQQGVLLLNASLSVRKGEPNSHAKYGWQTFTDAIISYLDRNNPNLVFMLWGGFAQKKGKSVSNRHLVLKATHPSPLGANKGGWFGCKHFSKANQYLIEHDLAPIDWNHLIDPDEATTPTVYYPSFESDASLACFFLSTRHYHS